MESNKIYGVAALPPRFRVIALALRLAKNQA